ncbi:hypothetical protein GQ53DRAFT_881160, partial [Thozetella sp. PMI_491]
DGFLDCMGSLAFPEMNDRPNHIPTPTDGTFNWLLKHPTYQGWITRDRGLLWIKGKPGSGKSTLLRSALAVIETLNVGNSALILSFFFHGRGTVLQRELVGLFRSLLYQLLAQVPDASPALVEDFKRRCGQAGELTRRTQWTEHELQRHLEISLSTVLENRPVWLLVDALDESGEENAAKLVRLLKSQLEELPTSSFDFRVCFASRHIPTLEASQSFEIILEYENSQDIRVYAEARLSTSPPLTRSQLAHLIATRAAGCFMWAVITVQQVLEMEQGGQNLQTIEWEITAIPQDLDGLYLRLIRDINDPVSLKLIEWICCSLQPISLEELRWAMIVGPEYGYQSLRQCENSEHFISDNDDMETKCTELSNSLIEVIPSSGKRIAQFIHESTKEFFIRVGLSALHDPRMSAETNGPGSDSAVGIANYKLSRACVRYMAMEEIAQATSHTRNELISKFALLHYATTSWLLHTTISEKKGISNDELLEDFTWPSNSCLQLWAQIYRLIDPGSVDCPAGDITMVHLASKYQWLGILQTILQKGQLDTIPIDSRDNNNNGRTPLLYAAWRGHKAIVKLLLDTGKVDIKSKDDNGQTPLSNAAYGEHEAVIKLLLDTGEVDIESRDNDGQTPLSNAAYKGHEAVVGLLKAHKSA